MPARLNCLPQLRLKKNSIVSEQYVVRTRKEDVSMKTKELALAALLVVAPATAKGETMNFGDAVALWARACGEAVETSCKGIRPGAGRLAECLQANASSQCQAATSAFGANMDARFAAQNNAASACRQDVERLCAGFQQGKARILRCLMRPDKFRAATPQCKNTLEAAGWLDQVSVKVR